MSTAGSATPGRRGGAQRGVVPQGTHGTTRRDPDHLELLPPARRRPEVEPDLRPSRLPAIPVRRPGRPAGHGPGQPAAALGRTLPGVPRDPQTLRCPARLPVIPLPGCTLALDVPTTTPGLAALLDGLGRAGGSRRGASTSPIPGCAQRCRPRCTTVSGSGGPSATGATPSGCCTPICPAAWASSTATSPRSGTLPRPGTKGKGQRERRSRLGAVCRSPRRRQRHRAGNRPPTGSRPHRDSGTCRPLPRAAERRRRGAVGCRGQHRRSRA